MIIEVRNNNVDRAIRVLKRKMTDEGLFKDMQKHVAYEKPGDKRRRMKRAAIARLKREIALKPE